MAARAELLLLLDITVGTWKRWGVQSRLGSLVINKNDHALTPNRNDYARAKKKKREGGRRRRRKKKKRKRRKRRKRKEGWDFLWKMFDRKVKERVEGR
jgi:hypothetical protein